MTFDEWWATNFGAAGADEWNAARHAWEAAAAVVRERCAQVASREGWCCMNQKCHESIAEQIRGKDADSYKLNPGEQRA